MFRALVFLASVAFPISAQYFKLSKNQLTGLTSSNPYERFDDGRPRVPEAMLEKVRGLTVEEAWGPLPGLGYPHQGRDRIRRPLRGEQCQAN